MNSSDDYSESDSSVDFCGFGFGNVQTNNKRKANKRTNKKKKARRGSKENAVKGWTGDFPNLSSSNSFESYADSDKQQAKPVRQRSAPKRGNSNSSEEVNLSKRVKKSNVDKDYVPRSRSKSLHQPDLPEIVPRLTRARSMCLSSNDAEQLLPGLSPPLRRRTITALKLPVTDDYYRLPFKYGWKRELVMSGASNKAHVIFISPEGKRLRLRADITPLLNGELTIDHFCFQTKMQEAGEQFETLIQSQPFSRRKTQNQEVANNDTNINNNNKSNLNTNNNTNKTPTSINTQVESVLPSPASAKRVPKPKLPKGASPPAGDWTATSAVRGNARILAASNSNANAGGGGSAVADAKHKRKRRTKHLSPNGTKHLSPNSTKVPTKASPSPRLVRNETCVHCSALIDISEAFKVPSSMNNFYICKSCVKPGGHSRSSTPLSLEGNVPPANIPPRRFKSPVVDENVNAIISVSANADAGRPQNAENIANATHCKGKFSLYGLAREIEMPGALPPEQLLSDYVPSGQPVIRSPSNPMDLVVIKGRKAVCVTNPAPSPSRSQVVIRDPDFTVYNNHFKLKQNQRLVQSVYNGYIGSQVIKAVMRTVDMHDRVRMAKVCSSWSTISRDRSVWHTVKLRDTQIKSWSLLLRAMSKNGTYNLDMMGVQMDKPEMRLACNLSMLVSLRILRTDACQAKFIEEVISHLSGLKELRATCTSHVLNLANIEKMVNLRVLRIRLTESTANITSLNPFQTMINLKELSLRGINMQQLKLMKLKGLKSLETLVLGCNLGTKVIQFGKVLLPHLKCLRKLRLEHSETHGSLDITAIMDGLALGKVHRVELINVDVDPNFSRRLSNCKSVKELMLLPNLHNKTAYMMQYVMQAISENSDQLAVFRLGITRELIGATGALAVNIESDCIPVVWPITGVSEQDILNNITDPIAFLPVDRLEAILNGMMPFGEVTLAKVSQRESTNMKFI